MSTLPPEGTPEGTARLFASAIKKEKIHYMYHGLNNIKHSSSTKSVSTI